MVCALVGALNLDESFGELERRLHGIVQTTAILGANDQPVDDDGDVVIHPPIELGRLGYLDKLSIDDRADETLFARGVEQLAEFSFATAHERSENLDPRALGPLQDGVGDLARALPLDGPPAAGAVWSAGARIKKSEIVVDLGDRAHCRARVMTGRFLLDGDRRR